jgi:hypothetical protein
VKASTKVTTMIKRKIGTGYVSGRSTRLVFKEHSHIYARVIPNARFPPLNSLEFDSLAFILKIDAKVDNGNC